MAKVGVVGTDPLPTIRDVGVALLAGFEAVVPAYKDNFLA